LASSFVSSAFVFPVTKSAQEFLLDIGQAEYCKEHWLVSLIQHNVSLHVMRG
jgi:hypothetical protein